MNIKWHYNDLPQSDPYKRYLVVYAWWDVNYKRNESPRFDFASYYRGEAPNYTYSDKPWHLDICHSVKEKEILAWAYIGEVGDVLKQREETIDDDRGEAIFNDLEY